MIVLDSNTISYYFRGDPQVVPRVQALRPADVGVPTRHPHRSHHHAPPGFAGHAQCARVFAGAWLAVAELARKHLSHSSVKTLASFLFRCNAPKTPAQAFSLLIRNMPQTIMLHEGQ
jgi:hypothetical protein